MPEMVISKRPTAAAQLNGGRKATKEQFFTYEEIEAQRLSFDDRVNREPTWAWVRKLAREMDLDSIETVVVWAVNTGRGQKHVVIDGQHRVRALLELGLGDWPLVCKVYHGLTVAEAAQKFRNLNKSRHVPAIEDFLKGLIAKDEECVAINDIVAKNKLQVSRGYGDGLISCVASLRAIYRGANGDEYLDLSLSIPMQAWGKVAVATEGNVVAGMGEFLRHARKHGGLDDINRLVKKLSKFEGGPTALVGRGKGMRQLRPSHTVPRGVATIIVDLYNRGHQEQNRLPTL